MATRGIERTDLGADASHEGFLRHRRYRWLKVAFAISLISLIAYAVADPVPRHNGGTWLGYTLGTIGALLILWLTMLGVRKRAMTRGKWSLKAWTSAHVYLGLSLIVVATLHTGFQFGWNVHTLAYALMMLVIVSGIYGIVVYSTLPQELSDNRAELTKSQMLDAVFKLDSQLQGAAQPLRSEDADLVLSSIGANPFKGGLWSRLTGKYRRCPTLKATRVLRERYQKAPTDEMVALDVVIKLLERKGAALGRIRRHLRIRALLEIWLFVHVPITFALIAALVAHIISVFFYW